jgi:hypothetical protein
MESLMLRPSVIRVNSCLFAAAFPAALALAQPSGQVVKPPVAQAWIDVATFTGMGLPMGMPGGAGGANPMSALGGMFGGGGGSAAQNHFGQTQSMSPGRWVDVTLTTRNNPQLAEALQAVPPSFLSPPLKLQSPKDVRGTAPDPGDERTVEREQERPKGKMFLYWGCSETVRAGQPVVVDFATASAADLARAFQSRRATQRGAHAAAGRPVWPSVVDTRMISPQASLVGEHAFSGQGVPEGFRFQLPPQQDLMPAIALKQQQAPGGATLLEWQALPTARAYFASAMGARGQNEMVVWSSSELPDMGFGLLDYQTNVAVDRWLGERVLLAPQTTRCAVPKGVFGGDGAMLRMIAFGSELNLAYPPRPTDTKMPWEPVWAVKVRVKSVTMAMLGMDSPEGMGRGRSASQESQPAEQPAQPGSGDAQPKMPGVADVLKGILGR